MSHLHSGRLALYYNCVSFCVHYNDKDLLDGGAYPPLPFIWAHINVPGHDGWENELEGRVIMILLYAILEEMGILNIF